MTANNVIIENKKYVNMKKEHSFWKNIFAWITIIVVMVISFPRSMVFSMGAMVRYVYMRLFKHGQNVSYTHIRYGSESFTDLDHADNNLANGFWGFVILALIILLIAK